MNKQSSPKVVDISLYFHSSVTLKMGCSHPKIQGTYQNGMNKQSSPKVVDMQSLKATFA